jgi:hypothetical protein
MPQPRRTPRPRLRAAQLAALLVLAGTGACGGGAGIGERCDSLSECASDLQCLNHICVPRCERHADCGDGFVCRDNGICEVVESQVGDLCVREIECGPGQFCQLDDEDNDQDGILAGECALEVSGGVLDAPCEADADCQQGTCALGRCVFLCVPEPDGSFEGEDLDCPAEHICSTIPRQIAPDGPVPAFYGCLPNSGDIVYRIPTTMDFQTLMLPVPGAARSLAVVMSVDDEDDLVGAAALRSPAGQTLYLEPLDRAEYFANPVRHDLAPGIATLLLPQTPDLPLEPGAYSIDVGTTGTEIPTVEVTYKLESAGPGVHLDVHFYFLDLTTHPCPLVNDVPVPSRAGEQTAADFETSTEFQIAFVDELEAIFNNAGVVLDLAEATYDDISGRADLDGLDRERLPELLSLSTHEGGAHIFFVRSISPAGLEGLVGGPPAPPGRPGTRASGVVIATDTLCYADWAYLARTTAHELARSLGLERSVEPDGYEDAISDTGYESSNLMYFSDQGGRTLSPDQSQILRLNPALHQ